MSGGRSSSQAIGGASGRRDVFPQVIENHVSLITRIVHSYEADPTARQELIQDVLLYIWVALRSFRSDSMSLKTFVATVAQKRSIAHVSKRASRLREDTLPYEVDEIDDVTLRTETKSALVQSIQQLPIPQREAIVLAFEGLSYNEIAEILGISKNAAMLRLQRAKSSLKTMLDRRSNDDELQRQYESNVERIFSIADEIFGDRTRGMAWLETPKKAFGGEVPMKMLRTQAGLRSVEEYLLRLRHGFFA